MRLEGDENRELAETLAATASLIKMRCGNCEDPSTKGACSGQRPGGSARLAHRTIRAGRSVAGGDALDGTEPPLSVEARAGFLSITHNALTNAFLHSRASRVEVRLESDYGTVRLSARDDGVSLPDDYATRGRGFSQHLLVAVGETHAFGG